MATSIADLLTTVDQATQSATIGAEDAARALHHTRRVLDALQVEGLGRDYSPGCVAAIRRLAESCADVATAFDQHAGRIGDLVGALGDAVGTLRRELVDADRWVVAVRLAPIARRCANAIRDSGPYTEVPELLGVLDRATELQRTAAMTSPDPDRIRGLDAPIPTTWRRTSLSADAAILDATATLAAEFRRRERPPATVRELIAVCHVASRVAERLARDTPAAVRTAEIWTQARNTLTQYTDGIPLPPPGQPRSRLLLQAMRVEASVQRATEANREAACAPSRQRNLAADGQRQLRRLANACHAELGRIAPTLMVLPGRAPITDRRVSEWLRREPFRANPPDLQPVLTQLQLATGSVETVLARSSTISR